MANSLGFSREGLDLALTLKHKYRSKEPLCLPGDDDHLLMPEHLLNLDINLEAFDDPLPLAVVASRDPDSPMAVAAAVRMAPLAGTSAVVSGVFGLLGETTKHPVVRQCVQMVTENDFHPDVVATVRGKASRYVVKSRRQYSTALKKNLRALINGDIEPRSFVGEFFQLTEDGNLRIDIRTRLVLSLLKSDQVRPSIKFLFLENFECLPRPVRYQLISEIKAAKSSPQLDLIREELTWMEKTQAPVSVH